jgi:hypothetical protein
MSFLRETFSDGGKGSASRVLTAVHSVVACSCLCYAVHKTGTVPDAVTVAGLGTFAGVHYAINTLKNIVAKPNGG